MLASQSRLAAQNSGASGSPAALTVDALPPPTPKHVAIIMDGNRRWGQREHGDGLRGHQAGAERLRSMCEHCIHRGIPFLSVFAFSTENWGRRREEVDALMRLASAFVLTQRDSLQRNGVRVLMSGSWDGVSEDLRAEIESLEAYTAENSRLTLAVCFNYGARKELQGACTALIARRLRDVVLLARAGTPSGSPQTCNKPIGGSPDCEGLGDVAETGELAETREEKTQAAGDDGDRVPTVPATSSGSSLMSGGLALPESITLTRAQLEALVAPVTADDVSSGLYTPDLPPPDLLIRTGGELRLSNFLLWQAAYSELYFVDTLWPDFDEDCFDAALQAFAERRRRFGK